MAKILDGELYLTAQEASTMLQVSYKTLQRWADAGERRIWVRANGNGHRKKESRPVQIEVRFTPGGFRLYRASNIEALQENFAFAD
jgi:predicted site-specific integrase-resolvase